ncbi:hypothetical protein ACQVBX_12835 [Dyella sp. KULCS107]|uniref:hypothetical protein n=1 Tax=Dyella sp. KULCS107 TaxID=3422216 RepID=UPI003D6FF3A3
MSQPATDSIATAAVSESQRIHGDAPPDDFDAGLLLTRVLPLAAMQAEAKRSQVGKARVRSKGGAM